MKNILLIVFTSLLFWGCTLNSAGTWKNESIKASLRTEMDGLNKQAINAFVKNNPAQFLGISGKALLDNTPEQELREYIHNLSGVITNSNYEIVDEYYVTNKTVGRSNTLIGDDYTLFYKALNKEMYTSLLAIEPVPNTTMLVGLIYGKYKEGWKINICQIGEYQFNGMSAVDFYEKSNEQYEKGHLVDAANNIYISKETMKPLNAILSYKKEAEITKAYHEIIKEANEKYLLPLEITSIKNKPILLEVRPKIFDEGVYPIVRYKTNLNIVDSIALEKEYLQIADFVEKEFKGIGEENKKILFTAFDKIPEGEEPVETYTFAYETK